MGNDTFLTVCPAYLADFRCTLDACPLGRQARTGRCPALRDLRIHDIYERSLRLTCPQAVLAVLTAPHPFHFLTERLRQEELSPVNHQLPSLAQPRPDHAFLLDLQRTSLRLLQTKRYATDARLVLLGIYLEDAMDYIGSGHGYKLGELIKSYTSPMFAARFHEALKSIAFEPLSHLDFLLGILKELAAAHALPRGGDIIPLVRRAYRLDDMPPDLDRVRRAYPLNRRARARLSLMLPQFPTRFLQHQFYTELYPCALPGGIIHNYWLFVLSYKLTELLLTASAVLERDHLTPARIAQLIASTACLPQTLAGREVLERTLRGREDDSLRLFRLLYDLPSSN